MILPSKHVRASHSLLGVGAVLLSYMTRPLTVSELWETAKAHPVVGNYRRFVMALDMLYAISAIEWEGGILARSTR